MDECLSGLFDEDWAIMGRLEVSGYGTIEDMGQGFMAAGMQNGHTY